MEEQLKVMYRKTDKEKDVFWKAWRKNVNSIWKEHEDKVIGIVVLLGRDGWDKKWKCLW